VPAWTEAEEATVEAAIAVEAEAAEAAEAAAASFSFLSPPTQPLAEKALLLIANVGRELGGSCIERNVDFFPALAPGCERLQGVDDVRFRRVKVVGVDHEQHTPVPLHGGRK
jgi:hypothetical protein